MIPLEYEYNSGKACNKSLIEGKYPYDVWIIDIQLICNSSEQVVFLEENNFICFLGC